MTHRALPDEPHRRYDPLRVRQLAFGWTAEDVRVLVRSALTNAPADQWRRHLGVVLDGLRA